jgi:hypothetical protein
MIFRKPHQAAAGQVAFSLKRRKLNGTKQNNSATVQLIDAIARFVAAIRGEQGVRTMRVSLFGKLARDQRREHAHDPSRRGYHIAWRENEVNHCPGCGRSHWIVGRLSAECGFCATALPLAETGLLGAGTYLHGRHPWETARAA